MGGMRTVLTNVACRLVLGSRPKTVLDDRGRTTGSKTMGAKAGLAGCVLSESGGRLARLVAEMALRPERIQAVGVLADQVIEHVVAFLIIKTLAFQTADDPVGHLPDQQAAVISVFHGVRDHLPQKVASP